MIASELEHVLDARVGAHVHKLLVEPRIVFREWDYGRPGEQYPCWTVLDDIGHSDTSIAYCEFGFGPRRPWGLVSSADDGNGAAGSIGMDSSWLSTFLEAFFESPAATALPIWRVFKEQPDRMRTPITDEGIWDATWRRRDEIQAGDPASRYHCGHSISFGR